MKKIIPSILFFLFSIVNSHAQIQANNLANWQDDSLVRTTAYNSRYNDVWGYARDGREYAIIGSTEAIHILDVTDPGNTTEIQRIAGHAAGTFLIHRDMKVYQDYLYCVADEGSSSLQIIDLSMLPDTAVQVYNSNEFVVTSHNLYIDSSQARLYILGKGSTTTALDISNPAAPVFLANYPKPGFPLPYVHDAYIENNIGYMNCASKGLWVVDFTDPVNPVALGSMDGYPGDGYNHSGWMAADGVHYFMCDETHGSPMKVVDVSDPSDLQVVKLFSPGFRSNEIPHNVAVKDGLLYVSHYYDGMQVFDVNNPLNPIRIAEYDTYPDADAAWYAGNWGIYPFLPSGNILLSDMQYGLFVVEKLPAAATQYLYVEENEFTRCSSENIEFDMTIGSGFANTGVTLSANTNNLGATVEFVPGATAMPGDVVTVLISNLSGTAGLTEELNIQVNDGTNGQSVAIFLLVDDGPESVSSIIEPADDSVISPDNISFDWTGVSGADAYRIEIAEDESDFSNTVIFDAVVFDHSFQLGNPLALQEQYFWRITTINDCGESVSDIWRFNTASVNSTSDLGGNKIALYPSPAVRYLVVDFEKLLSGPAHLEVFSAMGQRVFHDVLLPGESNLKINTTGFSDGLYFVKMKSGESMFTQRFVVRR